MSKPKAVMHQVTVTVDDDHKGGLSFRPDSDLWSEPHAHFRFEKDRHHMRKHDYHLVEFVLDDRTGTGLKFPSDPEEAMWVAKVEDPEHPICPDADTPSNYDVIDPICVCDDGQRLIVRNDNPRGEDWSFTLNLVNKAADSSSEQHVSWDPIISNGGGGN